ncbi:MAG: hypothetical protein R2847_10580 [Bacteroidia bacterium]
MTNDLAATSPKWKVVIIHNPPYSMWTRFRYRNGFNTDKIKYYARTGAV